MTLMTTDGIFSLIEQVAATSSKTEKEKLLKAHDGSGLLKRVLEYTYNPFKTYGIREKTLPDVDYYAGSTFSDPTWDLLDGLASRRLTGSAAVDAIKAEMMVLSADSANLLRRIILKDMRAGFSESTTNKVFKGLIPDFPYMRCSLPKDADLENFGWETGVVSQEKADGMFANVNHYLGGTVTIMSRQGSLFPIDQFEEIAADVRSALKEETQTHGEILVTVNGEVLPREQGNGVLNRVLKGEGFLPGERPILQTWDQIPLSAVVPKGKHVTPYLTRLMGLLHQLKALDGSRSVGIIPTKVVGSLSEAYAHYRELLAKKKEGTIIKHPKAIWRDGTSKEQVKLKLEVSVELKVVGFEAGKGKNEATFGSLICRSACDQLEVCVSGFTDAKRAEIHAARDSWVGKIITVKSNGIQKQDSEDSLHSLFLPRFVEERADKREADTLQSIRDQFEAAIA